MRNERGRDTQSHTGGARERFDRLLVSWVRFVVRRPVSTLAVVSLSALAATAYAVHEFAIDSDTGKLVSQDAPFRRNYDDFTEAFPNYDDVTLIVVTSESRIVARDSAIALAHALRGRPAIFETVVVLSEGEFFDEHGLLYLELDDLEEVIDRLAEAQPALAALSADMSIRGLSSELVNAIDSALDGEELSAGFARLSDRIADVAEGLLAGEPNPQSWESEFLYDPPGDEYELIIVRGVKDFGHEVPAERQIGTIRRVASDMGLVPENGVHVRLTGVVPLEHEELESAVSSVRLAGALSFFALSAIVIFGLRSLRVVVATLATVLVSVAWAFAGGVLAVGEFTTISLAFGVLIIGLGVDFSLHLCLRFQEGLAAADSNEEAMIGATRSVGRAVSLCALTSSIGFLSFVPTDYAGMSQLGVITSMGLFAALVAAFTVAPAVLALTRRPTARPVALAISSSVIVFVTRRARVVGISAILVGLAASVVASRVTFDFSTLGMRNPDSESVSTLMELHDQEIVTDYSVTVLAPNWEAVPALVDRLSALESVQDVQPPQSHLPVDEEVKLELLEQAQDFMWPVLRGTSSRIPPTAQERRDSVERLREALNRLSLAEAAASEGADTGGRADARVAPEVLESASRLREVLDRLLSATVDDATVSRFEELVLWDLPERLVWLKRALFAQSAEFGDLPKGLRDRLVAEDGRVVISVVPRENVVEFDAMRKFVDEVLEVAPMATGRPVVDAGMGEIVVGALQLALAIAIVAVGAVLWLALRSWIDSALVLTPILLATVLTIATGVLIDVHFNIINVVVIPLVLGLGVDNGIHIVSRFRESGRIEGVLRSSTPRAILLSGLTTLGAFGALLVSSHGGIRSLGVLLTLAMSYLLVCTLLVLPALLAWRAGGDERPVAGDAEQSPIRS